MRTTSVRTVRTHEYCVGVHFIPPPPTPPVDRRCTVQQQPLLLSRNPYEEVCTIVSATIRIYVMAPVCNPVLLWLSLLPVLRGICIGGGRRTDNTKSRLIKNDELHTAVMSVTIWHFIRKYRSSTRYAGSLKNSMITDVHCNEAGFRNISTSSRTRSGPPRCARRMWPGAPEYGDVMCTMFVSPVTGHSSKQQ